MFNTVQHTRGLQQQKHTHVLSAAACGTSLLVGSMGDDSAVEHAQRKVRPQTVLRTVTATIMKGHRGKAASTLAPVRSWQAARARSAAWTPPPVSSLCRRRRHSARRSPTFRVAVGACDRAVKLIIMLSHVAHQSQARCSAVDQRIPSSIPATASARHMPDMDNLSSRLHEDQIALKKAAHPVQSIPGCHRNRHAQQLPLSRRASGGTVVLQQHLRALKAVLRQLLLPVLCCMRCIRGRAHLAAGGTSRVLCLAENNRRI